MLILKAIWAAITALTVLITVNTSPKAVSTQGVELVSTDTFVLDNALHMGQGITTDGEYYYTSGAVTFCKYTAIAKYDFKTLKQVKCNTLALPMKYLKLGYDHIGGISYYNGKLYCPVEGEPDDEYIASIMVFDAKTLKFTGEYYPLDKEAFSDGVPWCAVDSATGLLYASKWGKADTVYVFDTADAMKPVKAITLTGLGTLDRIQGGEFYNGTLYLSRDQKGGNTKQVLKFDPQSGEVAVAFERDVGGENVEAEGLTVWPAEDGSLFHILDYNKVIGVFIHNYSVADIQPV